MVKKTKKSNPSTNQYQWYDPSDWGFTPSQDFKTTLRMIPIVLILIVGLSLGVTMSRSVAGTAQRLIDDHGGSNKSQLEEAYLAFMTGDYNQAVSISSAVIESDPENALAYHILGLSHARRGLIEEAALSFQTAIEIDPDFDLAWYDLGVVEESRGEFALSLVAYKKAAELEADDQRYIDAETRMERIVIGEAGWEWAERESENLFLEGITAVNRGGITDLTYAENIFLTLVRDRPYDVASRNMLGLTLAMQGRLDESEEILLRVVETEPGYSDAWYNLGMLHRSQGRLEDALNDFEIARSTSSLDNFRTIAAREADEIRVMIESESILPPPADSIENADVPDE